MIRHIETELIAWKNRSNKKPLLIRGARQVGKTFTVRKLGEQFENFVEINLEAEPELHEIFINNFGKPDLIVSQLALLKNVSITAGDTLLFLDEIQSCKEALKSLRYFYEKMPNLHVIAAGSLIEFVLQELSFPVGRIEYLFLFPLNFKEFLIANNERSLAEISVNKITPPIHLKFLNYLKLYFFVGGMPEVVHQYITTKNLIECSRLQTIIINTYRDDFNKYASQKGIQYLRKVFDSIPRFLGKKFKYTNVDDSIQAKVLAGALDLLTLSGLAYKCTHTSGNGVPLAAESDLKKFKAFFIDIGLSLKALGFVINEFPLLKLEDVINRGGLAEQFIAQEIVSSTSSNSHPELFYWHREQKSSSAEIDFLVSKGKDVVPVEVKSGVNKGKKSLQIFVSEKKSKEAFLLSLDPKVTRDGNVMHAPLYTYFLLKPGG